MSSKRIRISSTGALGLCLSFLVACGVAGAAEMRAARAGAGQDGAQKAGAKKAEGQDAGGEEIDPRALRFDEMSRLAYGRTDKGPGKHYYTEIYDLLLSRMRNDPIRILEIGIAKGGSLALWQDYFPKATIYGFDIKDKKEYENERVKTFVADQANREEMERAFAQCGEGDFDFILDDGGHEMDQQQICLAICFKHVKPGGYYILEDLHTSFPELWPNHGAAADGSNTTLRMIELFFRTEKIESQYMTPEEMAYLSEKIDFCNVFFRNNQGHSTVAIFKKRAN